MAELLINPEPLTVSVKPAPPEKAFVGEMLEIEGLGLLAALTVKVSAEAGDAVSIRDANKIASLGAENGTVTGGDNWLYCGALSVAVAVPT
jgi:hypothetical protein